MNGETKKPLDVDGFEIVTNAIYEMLNSYPGLTEEIGFSNLEKESGFSFLPASGAVIERQTEDVTGNVRQLCQYPFVLIKRSMATSEKQKIKVKELLDDIGRWLERQPVYLDGEAVQMPPYPELTNGRKIKSVKRTAPSYVDAMYEKGLTDWLIPIVVSYEVLFER